MLLNPLLLSLPLALAPAPLQDAAAEVPAARLASPHRLPVDLTALVPHDAAALIYMAPIDELEEAVQDLVLVLAPDMVTLVDVDALLLEAAPDDFDVDLIDRSRPMALAVGALDPMMQEEPAVYLMVPSTNPAELAAALPFPPELGWTRISGGYLGISPERAYPVSRGVSDLPGLLPEGLIAGTVNLEPILASMRPMVEGFGGMALAEALADIERDDEMPPALKPMVTGLLETGFESLLEGMDSLTGLDMAFDIDGARLEGGYSIRYHEGSMLSELSSIDGAHLADLVHLMDPDADFTMAVGMDLGGMVRWARPYVNEILNAIPLPEAFPAGEETGPFRSPRHVMDVARESLDHGMDALTWLGDGFAASTFVGEQDSMALWMHGVEAGNLTASLEALFQAELAGLVGLTLEQGRLGESTTQLTLRLDSGVLARNFSLSAEEAEGVRAGFAEAFGDAVRLSLTSVGDSTLVYFGGDAEGIKQALTRAARRPGSADPSLRSLVTELGDAHPFGVYRIDLGPVTAEILDMAAYYGDDDVPAGIAEQVRAISLPLVVKEGMTSTRIFQGFSLDLSQAGQVVGMLLEMQEEERRRWSEAELAPVPEPAHEHGHR